MYKILLILVSVSPLIVSVNAGEFYTSQDGNSFYVDNDTLLNWYDAIHVCASRNMRLITPDTEKKYLEITKLLSSMNFYGGIWTSGQETENLKFVWTTTGNSVTYTKWGTGEPSRTGNNTQCIAIRSYWMIIECLGRTHVVCEINPILNEKTQNLSGELNKSCCENETNTRLEELKQSCRNETQELSKANAEELHALKNEMKSYCENETNSKLEELKKLHENDRINLLDEKHREISVLKLDCEKQLNQLTLANNIQEAKIELMNTFHAKELRLLEEKQNRTGANKSYSFLFNVHGNRN